MLARPGARPDGADPGLYPDNAAPGMLLGLLDEIDACGFDVFIDQQEAAHERRALLDAWIGAPTWEESFDFLLQHWSALTTDEIRQLLAGASEDHDSARPHPRDPRPGAGDIDRGRLRNRH